MADPEAGLRQATTLLLLGSLSGCGFCGPGVPGTLRLPPVSAFQRGAVTVLDPHPSVPRKIGACGGEGGTRLGWPGSPKKFVI